MSASTSLSQVLKMLDQCAPGYTIRLATHSRVIQFGNKVYRTFPKHDPMENGHIRKMVRYLGISLSCASKHLPGVIKGDESASERTAGSERKPQEKPTAVSKEQKT